MGNTAVVLSNKPNTLGVDKQKGTHIDHHREVPSFEEWEQYLRNYSNRMSKSRKCLQCFAEFKNITSLLSHLSNTHHPTISFSTTTSTDEKPLCVECRNTFPTVKALQQHIEGNCKSYWNPSNAPDGRSKQAGQKRPKLKHPSDACKKVKLQKKESTNGSILSQSNSTSKKSVKTINLGSCIRQYSRPVIPANKAAAKVTKTLLPISAPKNKEKAVQPKAKTKSLLKGPGRVYSTKSLGLVDFEKIRTTARTRNMNSSKSLPDLTIIDTKSKIAPKSTGDAKSIDEVKNRIIHTIQPVAVGNSNTCNEENQHKMDNVKDVHNGLNKEFKSYIILKLAPLVSSPTNKTMVKPILPKQLTKLTKIQPKPHIVLQNPPKPLLVLKIPDCKANGPSTSNVAPNIFESVKGNPVKASKTYQATKRTRRIVSDLTTDDIVDEI